MNLESFDAIQKRFEFVQQHFHQLCRFCTETKNLLKIFMDVDAEDNRLFNEERNIGTLLEKNYLKFNPEDEFGLPNYICEKCVDNLVRWHRFQEAFILTSKLLLKVRDQHDLTRCVKEDPNVPSDPDDEWDEEIVEDDPPDENTSDGNEVYEIEYVQSLPEDAMEENCVTIIETITEPVLEDQYEKESKYKPIKEVLQSEIENDSELYNIKQSDLQEETYTIAEAHTVIRKKRRCPNEDQPNSEQLTPKPSQINQSQQCPVCGMLVKAKMKHHLMRHADPSGRPFKCTECDKSYRFKRTLADHFRQVHQNMRYPCEICKKEFVSRDVLRLHKKLHSMEEHRCEVCGQTFQQRVYLKKHMVVHEGKKFSCDDCGKSFRFKELMKQHMRIHTGEKPFQCGDCSKSFRTSSHLKQHQRTHTKAKVFKCKLCTVAYANKKSLDRHILMTHEEKGDPTAESESNADLTDDWKCDYCEEKFPGKRALTMHTRKFHQQELQGERKEKNEYKCIICSEEFARESVLNTHLKMHELMAFEKENGQRQELEFLMKKELQKSSSEADVFNDSVNESQTNISSNAKKKSDADMVFVCMVCEDEFEERETLLKHQKKLHKELQLNIVSGGQEDNRAKSNN